MYMYCGVCFVCVCIFVLCVVGLLVFFCALEGDYLYMCIFVVVFVLCV